MTMYNLPQRRLVANPINRYATGSRRLNADGSADIWLQTASPGKDKGSNWLPTPEKGPDQFIRSPLLVARGFGQILQHLVERETAGFLARGEFLERGQELPDVLLRRHE